MSKYILIFDGTSISTYDIDEEETLAVVPALAEPPFLSSYTVLSGGLWQYVDIGDTWFACNGSSLVFDAQIEEGKVMGATLGAAAIGKANTRLVVGGVIGSWFSGVKFLEVFERWRKTQGQAAVLYSDMALTKNFVMWSGVAGDANDKPYLTFLAMLGVLGNDLFDELKPDILDAVERGTIGMYPVPKVGDVLAVKGHGLRINVYGTQGCSVLEQREDGRWVDSLALQTGILGRMAIDGTDSLHVFLDDQFNIWYYQLGEGVKKLEYSQYFEEFEPDETVVTYEPVEDEYWISDGTESYVLTREGLGGPVTAGVMGLARDEEGSLVGIRLDEDGDMTNVKVKTNTFNMDLRDMKHTTAVQFQMSGVQGSSEEGGPSSPQCSIEWQGVDGDFEEGFSDPVNDDGVAFPNTSFRDGRIILEGWSPEQNAKIWDIQLRYNSEGKAYLRGTTPTGDFSEDAG